MSSAVRISEPIVYRDEQHLAGILWTTRALVNRVGFQLALIDRDRNSVTLYTRVNRPKAEEK